MPAKPKCGRPLRKKPGKFCQRTDLFPNGACYIHGGPSKVGPAHPNFKHGKHSIHLPAKLGEKYDEYREDPGLNELRDLIALTDALKVDRMDRLYAGESLDGWKRVGELVGELEDAMKLIKGRKPVVELLKQITKTVHGGIQSYRVFEEIQPMIEQRRKLTESEAKRLKDLGQNITAEKLISLVGRFGKVVTEHIMAADIDEAVKEDLRDRISRDVHGILSR